MHRSSPFLAVIQPCVIGAGIGVGDRMGVVEWGWGLEKIDVIGHPHTSNQACARTPENTDRTVSPNGFTENGVSYLASLNIASLIFSFKMTQSLSFIIIMRKENRMRE